MSKNTPTNVAKSVFTSIASSFNSIFNYWGISMNNNTHVINNLYFTREPKNIKKNDSSTVDQKIVDQSALFTEVFPNDEKIIKLIWNYLNIDDKFNCTMVCKRFNNIVSEMECFRLIVNLPSMVRVIPRLSRSYKTVIFQSYQCTDLKPLMRQMLKHLSHSVIDLRFYDCKFNLMTLCEFLRELPLLESLVLDMTLTFKKDVEISVEDIPKFLNLRDFKIKVNADKLDETLVITGCALNIESLSLYEAIFDINVFNDYLIQYKNSLKSLSLTKCIIHKSVNLAKLNTLRINSVIKLQPKDYGSFDCLNKLRVLHLTDVNTEMLGILNTKCISWLTDLEVIYTSQQKENMSDFYMKYIFQNGYKRNIEISLSETWIGPIRKKYKNLSYKNHIKYHRKNTDEDAIKSFFEYKYFLCYKEFKPVPLSNIILKWHNNDCVDNWNIYKTKMGSILNVIAEHDQTLAATWLNSSQKNQLTNDIQNFPQHL